MLGVLPALGKSKKTSFPVSAGSPNSPAFLMPYTPRRMSKSTASIFFSVRNTFAIETLMMLTSSFSFQDVLLVNQTADTLQNLCLDFATLGDLKLVERPTIHTLAPHSFLSIKATIKVCFFFLPNINRHTLIYVVQVSSTETGVIFGNILWEGVGLTESCVVLNDIHIDIMDYIKPAYCNEAQFRSMWTEFEWENRVNVTTTITYVHLCLCEECFSDLAHQQTGISKATSNTL